MCRAGSGLGGRVLDSVFIFQMVMMKTRKIHEFFPTDLLNKTLISNQCENFPSKKNSSTELHCIQEFLFPYHVVRRRLEEEEVS